MYFSVGGLFWIGWLRDLFYIPSYVADVNEDPEFMRELTEKMQKRQRPEVSNSRFIGKRLSSIYLMVAQLSLPNNESDSLMISCVQKVNLSTMW